MIDIPIQVRLILDLGRKQAQTKFKRSNSEYRYIRGFCILEDNLISQTSLCRKSVAFPTLATLSNI